MTPDIKLTWYKLAMLQNAAFFGKTFAKPEGAVQEFRELEKFLAGIGVAFKDKGSVVIELLGDGPEGQ